MSFLELRAKAPLFVVLQVTLGPSIMDTSQTTTTEKFTALSSP